MPRAYSISASDIAAERERVGGDLGQFDVSHVIRLDELTLRPMGSRDVHLRILAVSGEHNVDHAALADTVNIVAQREGKIYPGNSAVGEVIATGEEVRSVKIGDIVVTHCNGEPDEHGYPFRIWAYDQPHSVGFYAEEAVLGEWQVIRAPLDCGLNLWEIAALPLRAPTAHHLWRRAIGIYRLKVPGHGTGWTPRLNVLAFGGGTSELFLMLAKHEGHRAFFCSGNPERRVALEKLGIKGIDQNQFNRFKSPADIKAFNAHVRSRVGEPGVHIVCDMLRGPVFEAGLRIAAREGVNVSAGWQLARECTYNSANLSVKQITLDHAHYETIAGCRAATELYGKVFKPTVHKEVYAFEDLPRAMHELHQSSQSGIPIIRVAKEMPQVVHELLGEPSK